MQDGNSGEAGVSIGQDDQCRDRAMEKEQLMREAVGGTYGSDPTDTPEEQQGRTHAPDRPMTRRGDRPDDFRPGQGSQPERSESGGLTGTGPAQPE